MPLTLGTRFGPYHVHSLLGAGGMGEVYRATDIRLHRDIALKVLPGAFAQDAIRMERLEREGHALAALNHPNIASIYGIEGYALAMELVEGETLAARMAKGALPLRDALDIAKQIACGLEAAHNRGIIHRDLKPANVKVTPEGVVKILDFGLAKRNDDVSPAGLTANSPTVTVDATQTGMIVGTAQYMSPEQARGEPVDARADIWSFGVLLYGLLTGTEPFSRRTVTDTLAAVLTTEPDWQQVPEAIRPIVRRCVCKNPKDRWRSIADVRLLLEEPPPAGSVAIQARRPVLPWVVAALFAIVSGFALWSRSRVPKQGEQSLMQFAELQGPGPSTASGRGVAVSPDATRLAYVAAGPDSVRRIFLRKLNQPGVSALAGTEGAAYPFFSPDSRWLGFFAEGKLKKIAAEGGLAIVLCDAPSGRGGAFDSNGNIVAALSNRAALSLVAASGGTPKPLTAVDAEKQENSHRWPQILPGGKTVLFTASEAGGGTLLHPRIEAQTLASGQRRTLVNKGIFGRYLPAGFLVYVESGTLFAARMDLQRLEITGAAVPILDEVYSSPGTGDALFGFSDTGVFAYVNGSEPQQALAVYWMGSNGKLQPFLTRARNYSGLRLSSDGKRAAFAISEGGNTGIWIYDSDRQNTTPLTFSTGIEEAPVWAPDGKRIAFRTERGMQWVRSDGSGEPEPLTDSRKPQYPNSFTPDGKVLFYEELDTATGLDIWLLPVESSEVNQSHRGTAQVWLKTQFNEAAPAVSPDGRWVAYRSDESGRSEVYVRPIGKQGGKWQISSGGADYPVWSGDAATLYYRTPDSRLHDCPLPGYRRFVYPGQTPSLVHTGFLGDWIYPEFRSRAGWTPVRGADSAR